MFLRRMGFKEYAETFFNYGVDGNILLKLTDDDFENLNINNKIHRKKILVELERICPLADRTDVEDVDDLHIRRERMKNLKRRTYAVCVIQRIYRRFAGKMFIQRLKLKVNLNYRKQLLQHNITVNDGWWTDKEIPSKSMTNLTLEVLEENERIRREKEDILLLKKKKEREKAIRIKKSYLEKKGFLVEAEKYTIKNEKNNQNNHGEDNANAENTVRRGSVNSFFSKKSAKTSSAFTSENNGDDDTEGTNVLDSAILQRNNMTMSYIGNNNVNEKNDDKLKLPNIKTFGRKADRVTINGWGKYNDVGSWIPLIKNPEGKKDDFSNDKNGNGDVNIALDKPDVSTDNAKNMNCLNDNIANTMKKATRNEFGVTVITPQNPNGNMHHDANRKYNLEHNKLNTNIVINNNKSIILNEDEFSPDISDLKVFTVIDDLTHNPTRLLTQKLKNSGYDKRRQENFLENRMN